MESNLRTENRGYYQRENARAREVTTSQPIRPYNLTRDQCRVICSEFPSTPALDRRFESDRCYQEELGGYRQNVKYFNDIQKSLKERQWPHKRFLDERNNKIPVLKRMEFLSETLQMAYKAQDMSLVSARTNDDVFCESPRYKEDGSKEEENAKSVIKARRDFMMWYLPEEVRWVGFMIVQNRALFRVKCQNPPYGMLGSLSCNRDTCQQIGPCHEFHSEMNLLNISR